MNNVFFSDILGACLTHGTDNVVQLLKSELNAENNPVNSNSGNNGNAQETSVPSIEDDTIDTASEQEVENETTDSYSGSDSDLNMESHSHSDSNGIERVSNRRKIGISLHIQSLMQHPNINNNCDNNRQRNSSAAGSAYFIPSTFQNAILSHMNWQRSIVGHKIGLNIMATAMGKTVIAILDIHRELIHIHQTFGIEYGIGLEFLVSKRNSAKTEEEEEKQKDEDEHGSESNHDKHDGFGCCPCVLHSYFANDLKIAVKSKLDRMTYHSHVYHNEGHNRISNHNNAIPKPVCKVQTPIIAFRLLFVVHTKAIRNSAYFKFKKHFQSFYNGLLPDSYFLKIEPNTKSYQISDAKFIFVLFQSFNKLLLSPNVSENESANQTHLQSVTHIIIDEVHHLLAETWLKVYECIMDVNHCPSLEYCLGMTATLSHRSDVLGHKLKSLFLNIIYIRFPWIIAKQMSFFPTVEYLEALPTLRHGRDVLTYHQYLQQFREQLQAISFVGRSQKNSNSNSNSNASTLKRHAEYIRKLKSRALNTFLLNLDKSLISLRMGTDQQIRHILTPEYIVQLLLQYQSMQARDCKKRKILIFSQNANDATQIASICNHNGMKAGAIHYKINPEKVTQLLYDFRYSNKLQVLVNVNVFNEGYDLPAIDFVVLARITKSEIIFVQQLGRALRKCASSNSSSNAMQKQEKNVCVLDLALNLRRRWRLLRDGTNADVYSDEQIIEYILNFWNVHNFVGAFVTMSPSK